MNEIMAIASSTWQRVLRMRSVYFLILCVFILIGSALNYDVLSMNEHKALTIDISLALNTVAMILMVVSMSFEIPRELREGVASTLLSKPLGRTEYLAGKMIGTAITGLVISAIIAAGSVIIIKIAFTEQTALSMLQSHILVGLSVIPMSAIGVLFSIIIPEMITPIITVIAIWFAFSTKALSGIKLLYGGILPDLDFFNLKALAVYGEKIPWEYVGMALLWGIVYSIFVVSLASLIFRYKDIK